MDPAVGVSSPARICNKVVLPQPDEPMMPIDLPSINSRDILSINDQEILKNYIDKIKLNLITDFINRFDIDEFKKRFNKIKEF